MSKTLPNKFGHKPSGRPRRPIPPAGATPSPDSQAIDLFPSPSDRVSHVRWAAWSNDGTRVIARAWSLESARQAARDRGEPDPIVEPVPNPSRRA